MTLAKYLGKESCRTQRERTQRRKKEVREVARGCGGDGGGGGWWKLYSCYSRHSRPFISSDMRFIDCLSVPWSQKEKRAGRLDSSLNEAGSKLYGRSVRITRKADPQLEATWAVVVFGMCASLKGNNPCLGQTDRNHYPHTTTSLSLGACLP